MKNYEFYDYMHPISDKDFEDMYVLMEKAFPASERRTRQEQSALSHKKQYHITLLRDTSGCVAAFFAWWSLAVCCYGEHFAVDDVLRGQGIGGEMLEMLVREQKTPGSFVLEVEPPLTDFAARRIGFYQRHGFVLNAYDYLQPALQQEFQPLPLLIMSHPNPLKIADFEIIRAELYHDVYETDLNTVCGGKQK